MLAFWHRCTLPLLLKHEKGAVPMRDSETFTEYPCGHPAGLLSLEQ